MIDQSWFILVIAGIIGGLARAFYGMYKAVNAGYEINIWYFIITVISSGIIGGILGILFDVDYRVASLMGYVGTDVLENVLKSSMPNKITINK
jgi:fluoride ion exporter CrcB/FEX